MASRISNAARNDCTACSGRACGVLYEPDVVMARGNSIPQVVDRGVALGEVLAKSEHLLIQAEGLVKPSKPPVQTRKVVNARSKRFQIFVDVRFFLGDPPENLDGFFKGPRSGFEVDLPFESRKILENACPSILVHDVLGVPIRDLITVDQGAAIGRQGIFAMANLPLKAADFLESRGDILEQEWCHRAALLVALRTGRDTR